MDTLRVGEEGLDAVDSRGQLEGADGSKDAYGQQTIVSPGLGWVVWTLLTEPSCHVLVWTAVVTLVVGCWRALVYDQRMRRQNKDRKSEEGQDGDLFHHVLSHRHVLMIPIVSSISLLVMFFLFTYIQYIMVVFSIGTAGYSLYFLLEPVVSLTWRKCLGGETYASVNDIVTNSRIDRTGFIISDEQLTGVDTVYNPRTTTMHVGGAQYARISRPHHIITWSLVVALLTMWMLSGWWVLNNLLGMALCIALLSHVRLPNFKVCVILLGGLFLYDIFWVFGSEFFFGRNVMTTAAMQQADNVAYHVAESFDLPMRQYMPTKIELPMKFIFPQPLHVFFGDDSNTLMLGCGDVAIPGLVVLLSLYADRKHRALLPMTGNALSIRRSSIREVLGLWNTLYTVRCLAGYMFGLYMALICGTFFQAAQPALFYLVPCTLTSVFYLAIKKKEFKMLWQGDFPNLDSDMIDLK